MDILDHDSLILLFGGLMGLAILSGADKWLEARVNNWLPESWLGLTVAI